MVAGVRYAEDRAVDRAPYHVVHALSMHGEVEISVLEALELEKAGNAEDSYVE